jgi:hypothetical protein
MFILAKKATVNYLDIHNVWIVAGRVAADEIVLPMI